MHLRHHQVVHSALGTAVRTLSLARAHEQRLLAMLDEAHHSFSEGRVSEGIVTLRRFSLLIDAVSKVHHGPPRLRRSGSPYDRLSQARRRSTGAAPG